MNEYTTLASILQESPDSGAVFERYGLDYCCGAKKTLSEACQKSGANIQDVLSELRHSERTDTFGHLHPSLWDVPFLIAFIVQNHHQYVRSTFPRLMELSSKVLHKHGERYSEVAEIFSLLEDLKVELLNHLEDEEQGLFSMNRHSLTEDSLRAMIGVHEQDHSNVGKKLIELRELTGKFQPPEGACNSHRTMYSLIKEMVQDTMQHIYLENYVLYPKMLSENTKNHYLTTSQVQGG